jgi:hypothetical protein
VPTGEGNDSFLFFTQKSFPVSNKATVSIACVDNGDGFLAVDPGLRSFKMYGSLFAFCRLLSKIILSPFAGSKN